MAKKNDRGLLPWLRDQMERAQSEAEMAENEAEEYERAIQRFKETGSVPRDIRDEWRKEQARRRR